MANVVGTTAGRVKSYFSEVFSGLVPLFVVAHFMHHVPGFILQPATPSIRDTLGLDYVQVGGLTSAYNFAYGVANLPAGWLGGRMAPRLLITAGVLGLAVFGILAGLAPNYVLLVLVLLLMGVMGGGYHPSAAPLIADTTAPEKRGRALGLHQVGGTLASFVTPLIVGGLMAALTWRGAFVVLSIPVALYGIYLYILLRRRHLGDKPVPDTSGSFVIRVKSKGYVRRMIAFVAMGTAVQVFVYSTLSFIPLLVTDQYHGSAEAGAAFFALAQFAGLLAGPIGGHMSDRIGKVPVMLTVGLLAGPLIYLLSLGTHWWLLAILMLAVGTCMYVAMPVSEAYVISNSSQRNRSTILGIYYFASRGGPGLLSPFMGGLIQTYSFGHAFAAAGAGLFLVTLVCSLLLFGTRD